ncbi:3-dehydroquinate synthase II [Phytoactinopolyspora limicola]|uniref:3-dehydroquinate synthase II n=1 Tax=Phytoactinopolyspora limicola TaxID=2715536 RepID=UPI00140ACC7E|nr:3-dehydroquinate synthase II [Phytoactinopolyspora limicola]
MKLCWIDIRGSGTEMNAIVEEAVHLHVDALVSDDPVDLRDLPASVSRVLLLESRPVPDSFDGVDIVIVDADRDPAELAAEHPQVDFGRRVEVNDSPSLNLACEVARSDPWCVLEFRDPTKIPLEIILAAADKAEGSLITVVRDVAEAEIVFDVLEHGSDGVLLAPQAVGESAKLNAAAKPDSRDIALTELTVVSITDVGMGDRVCVDSCLHFREDEGILVGSYSQGMILCSSETHPLPYMPTRPFRVNAGALHSYTLVGAERTGYLSELRSGGKVLAVDSSGRTRPIVVGRVKIESRPLLSIDAEGPDGQKVNLIIQHDWHVRVLGPGGVVLNSTEFKPGDRVLGYLSSAARHVGYAVDEFCLEK